MEMEDMTGLFVPPRRVELVQCSIGMVTVAVSVLPRWLIWMIALICPDEKDGGATDPRALPRREVSNWCF
ncbi:hypothetical protein E4U43_004489, partial [Claviceps pusilla]